MAQFIGLVTLPDGIDGKGATDGHVWTADGADGAGWEAAAGGGGGLTSEYPAGTIQAADAENASANGVYLVNSTQNGKVDYIGENPLATIYWDGSVWIIDYDGTSLYVNVDDVATPDLVSSAWMTYNAYTYPGAVQVSGAGSSQVNGDYEVTGEVEGRPSYQSLDNGSATIYTVFSDPDYIWVIDYDGDSYYESTDNVATPDLATTWTASHGDEPVPTVAAIPDSVLSVAQVANYPENYVPLSDGSGGYAWGVIPAAWPTVSVTGDWTDADTALDDILAGLGIEMPPSDGENSGMTLYFVCHTTGTNWGVLSAYVDYDVPQTAWKGNNRWIDGYPSSGLVSIVSIYSASY